MLFWALFILCNITAILSIGEMEYTDSLKKEVAFCFSSCELPKVLNRTVSTLFWCLTVQSLHPFTAMHYLGKLKKKMKNEKNE